MNKQEQSLLEAQQLFANMSHDDFMEQLSFDHTKERSHGVPTLQDFSDNLKHLIQVNSVSKQLFESFLGILKSGGVKLGKEHYDYIYHLELTKGFKMSTLNKKMTGTTMSQRLGVQTVLLFNYEGIWSLGRFKVDECCYELFLFVNADTKLVMFQWVQQDVSTLKYLLALLSKIETLPPRI